MHYTIVPAADELLFQPAASFCPSVQSLGPCNYRPRVQIVSKGPRECVPRTLVSASSDKHTLCQAGIYPRSDPEVGPHSTRRIIKAYTLKIIQMPLRGTVAQFYFTAGNFCGTFKLPSFICLNKIMLFIRLFSWKIFSFQSFIKLPLAEESKWAHISFLYIDTSFSIFPKKSKLVLFKTFLIGSRTMWMEKNIYYIEA